MVLLNLQKINLSAEAPGNKVTHAIQEARNNHNILVGALNTLSKQLEEINSKLDKPENPELSERIKVIEDTVIPQLKTKIDKKHKLAEAKITEATNELNLQHEQLEAHGRRLNVILHGKAEVKQTVQTGFGGRREFEDTEKLFREFLVDSLKLEKTYVDNMILRDAHRLPKSQKSNGPPPIIAAFISQRHRNDVLAAAKNLQNTGFSVKSDLPKRLNDIRGKMLGRRRTLKEDGKVVRLVERNYLPILQEQNTVTKKWNTIADINTVMDREDATGDAPDVIDSDVET